MLFKLIIIGAECSFLMLITPTFGGCSKRLAPKGGVGNTGPTTEFEPVGTITKGKAVQLAQQELMKTGENPGDYQVLVEDDPIGKKWVISFEKTYSPTWLRPPGGGFWAIVDKESGKVFFRAGD